MQTSGNVGSSQEYNKATHGSLRHEKYAGHERYPCLARSNIAPAPCRYQRPDKHKSNKRSNQAVETIDIRQVKLDCPLWRCSAQRPTRTSQCRAAMGSPEIGRAHV